MQNLKVIIKKILPKSTYGKSVITLITGTGLAQVLPIALSPILTRLYTPEDFGVFALYASVCAILVVLVTGKYELAIVVCRYESEAINLVALTGLLSLLVSLILLGILLVWGETIVDAFGFAEAAQWLYLVPFTTLILGFYHALNFWANRRSRYKTMATSRIVQSASGGAGQLTAGVSKLGSDGLIIGQIIGQLLCTAFLAISMYRNIQKFFRRVSVSRMCYVAYKHINYPKYMVPGQVMNVGATELPLLALTIFFGTGVAGFYSLAHRVTAAPMSLVANAIGDVYRQGAAAQYVSQGNCLTLFLVSLKRLLMFAFLPMLPIVLFGPSLFSFVFGDGWRTAGEIASALSILVFFQTVASPLSSTILLPGWLHLDSLWQFARLCFVGFTFFLCKSMSLGYMATVLILVCGLSGLFLLHSIFQYKAAQGEAYR